MTKMTTKSKTQDKSKMCEIDDHILRLFEIKKRLGKGAYGIVWKAIDKRTDDIVAVKKIFDAFRDQTDAQRTFREIIFLNAFRSHPNIVQLHNVYRATNNLDIYLVFEYMESDLHNIIKRGSVLKDVHKRYVIYQLINAIKYIHSGNVIHRDLKPSNILIDSKCRCKLADFGLARSVSNRDANVEDLNSEQLLTDYVATRWYRAPEILVASKRYTKGIDMWSLGCILGEMMHGKPLFQGNSTVNQIEHILCALPEITNHDIGAIGADFGSALLNRPISREKRSCLEDILGNIPSDAMDLIKSLLVFDPLARLTAAQALEHPYVMKFRHTIEETDLDIDIIPPFSDDIRLTVPQYREKLYEIVEDVPKMRANKSATSAQTRRAVIPNYEKRSHSKSKIPNSQHLERKESRERLPTAKKSTSQESMATQVRNVPIKTMISTLASSKTINQSIPPNNDVKPVRKINKTHHLKAALNNNNVETCTEQVVVPNPSQESVENVRSLIKKRVSSTTKLVNFNQNKQEQQTSIKSQTILQQQLQQNFLKQQLQVAHKQQQKLHNDQQQQQQQKTPEHLHENDNIETNYVRTCDSIKNLRSRININAQHPTRLHRETINNNDMNINNRDFIKEADKRTKSAEYTINRQGFPTITKDKETVEDVHCYEERLRRIEEEINCYKDEVKSYAYDNLRSSKHKLEMSTKSCDRVTPLHKPQAHNNKIINGHCNYSPTSSSSHYSSESDVPAVRAKNNFTNFPTVFAKNSFYQFVQRQKNKPIAAGVTETGTGGSGDHIIDYRQTNQQKLQFKRNVTNLIKAHLQPTQSMTTIQQSTVPESTPDLTKNMLFSTTTQYRYKSSSKRKPSTKAF